MTAWPPPKLLHITRQFAIWDAWYTGDRYALEVTNSQGNPRVGIVGVVQRVWRRFWGAPVMDLAGEPKIKVHVPLAADIARASADLLFADPPTLTSDNPATADALQDYLDDGLLGVLAGAAEVGAALGGVYLRATWDEGTQEVFCTRVDYDQAVPTFYFGALVAVTFWRKIAEDGNVVWWHLEIHEEQNDIGIVRHQLWRGTLTDLGNAVPLTDRPETAPLALLVEDGDTISSGTPGLAVVHIPNVTPNSLWRKDPIGANLGQADIAGCEDLLDRLDHCFSALMLEVDLARARIILPEYMLTTGLPGNGQTWDADRAIWSPVGAPASQSLKPELYQPDIRVEKMLAVMQEITENILRRAGYSLGTFGEDANQMRTATEVISRDRRSVMTRSRKLRIVVPAMEELLGKMISIETTLFHQPYKPDTVQVIFPNASQATELDLSLTVAAMNTAVAASVETKVRTLHPDWEDDQVDTEVALIKAETGQTVEDPTTFGQGGQGLQLTNPEPPAQTPTTDAAAANQVTVGTNPQGAQNV